MTEMEQIGTRLDGTPVLRLRRILTLPESRTALDAIAERLPYASSPAELRRLAGEIKAHTAGMQRRYHGRVKPRQKSLNATRARAIREYAAAHPNLTEFDVSQPFNVNQARTSEALWGKRGEQEPAPPPPGLLDEALL